MIRPTKGPVARDGAPGLKQFTGLFNLRAVLRFVTCLITSGLLSGPGARAHTSLYAEWMAETNARLAKLMPRRATARHGSASGVSITDLAEVLGTSVPLASMLLRGRGRHFNVKHAEKVARHFKVRINDVLAVDLLNRFASAEDVAAALDGEPPALVDFFLRLYARRSTLALAKAPPLAENEAKVATPRAPTVDVVEFVRRWRAEVNRRLAQLMPEAVVGGSAPRVSLDTLASVLGQPRSVCFDLVHGTRSLTYHQAEKISARSGVKPEWILALSVVGEFASRAEVERTFGTEARGLGPLMLHLHEASLADCRSRLAIGR